MVKKTKNKHKKKKIKSGTGSPTKSLWREIMAITGERLGTDLDKRLKVVSEVITTTIVRENDRKLKKLEDKINLLEQKVIDISSDNSELTRTLSEFVS
jgi:sporulation protein YlmC with PRC-barrel domain